MCFSEKGVCRVKKGIVQLAAFGLSTVMLSGSISMPAWAKKAGSVAGTIGFVDLEDSTNTVNIRAAADLETGEVVGVLKNHDSVEIKKVTKDGWYKVVSGEVKGFVAGYLIATGKEAEEIARETAYHYIIVRASQLGVYESPDPDSEIVAVLNAGDEAEMVEDSGDWLKICLSQDCYGYVPASGAEKKVAYPTAMTIQEFEAESEAYTVSLMSAGYDGEAPAAEAQTAVYSEETSGAAQEAAYMAQETSASYDSGASGQETFTEYAYAKEQDDASQSGTYVLNISDAELSDGDGDYIYSEEDEQGGESADTSGTYSGEPVYSEQTTAADAGTAGQETVSDDCYIDAAAGQGASADLVYSTVSFEGDYVISTDSSQADYAENSDQGQTDYSQQTQEASTETNTDYSADQAAAEQTQDTAGTYTGETGDSAPAPSDLGASLAVYAQQFVGNPYVWGGSSLTEGADCSGFTMAVFACYGVSLPHSAADQSGYGVSVSLDSLAPGDLVFFNSTGSIDHVAIYIGNGQIVHAANSSSGIVITELSYMSPVAACRVI